MGENARIMEGIKDSVWFAEVRSYANRLVFGLANKNHSVLTAGGGLFVVKIVLMQAGSRRDVQDVAGQHVVERNAPMLENSRFFVEFVAGVLFVSQIVPTL